MNPAIDRMFDEAIERNQEFNSKLMDKKGIVPDPVNTQLLSSQIELIKAQTKKEMVNITRSLGFAEKIGGKVVFKPAAKMYQDTLDFATMQVSSGVTDYNTAIRQAVSKLTNSGLRSIDYATGSTNKVDVAARRAVMTGIGQISGEQTKLAMQELDTDLVEVSAHAGARDTGGGYINHKSWQGKVYSLSGNSDKYPSLTAVTGYGSGGGLQGWNCRHNFYPFLEGISERTYTDQQLKDIDSKPFTYEGKQYTAYEATQQQRKLETAIRKTKLDLVGFESAGLKDDFTTSSIKLRRLREYYKDFSGKAGLKTQLERAQVAGFGKGTARKSYSDYKKLANKADSMYNMGSEEENIKGYLRDKHLRENIQSRAVNKTILQGRQNKHISGTAEHGRYTKELQAIKQFGPSRLEIDLTEAQRLVDEYAGTGILMRNKTGAWNKEEIITFHDKRIGKAVNNLTGKEAETTVFKIKYSKNGTHIVPDYPSKKGAKATR